MRVGRRFFDLAGQPLNLDALKQTNYKGVTGTIAFDEKGDIKGGAISMFNVKEGKLNYLSTVR